jgi:hypothetical protein
MFFKMTHIHRENRGISKLSRTLLLRATFSVKKQTFSQSFEVFRLPFFEFLFSVTKFFFFCKAKAKAITAMMSATA